MKCFDEQRRFVELRSGGMSYSRIAEELGVGRRTLVRWSKDLAIDINNLRAIKLESLREEYLLGKEHRIKVLGMQLQMIAQEILKRDLGDVATHRLFEMQSRVIREVGEFCDKIEFAGEKSNGVVDVLKEAMKKVEKWAG